MPLGSGGDAGIRYHSLKAQEDSTGSSAPGDSIGAVNLPTVSAPATGAQGLFPACGALPRGGQGATAGQAWWQVLSRRSSLVASSPLAFFTVNVIVSCLPLPLAGFLAGVAGSSYGIVMGTLLYVVSATAGSMVVVALGRSNLRPAAVRALSRWGYADKVSLFDAAIEKTGPLTLVALLRLSPVFPFAVTSLLLSLCDISLRTYSTATLLGLCPSSFVFILVGDSGTRAAGGQMINTDVAVSIGSFMATVMVTWKVVKVANSVLNKSLEPSTASKV